MVRHDKNNKIVICDITIIYVYIYIMIIFETNVFTEIVGNSFEKKREYNMFACICNGNFMRDITGV